MNHLRENTPLEVVLGEKRSFTAASPRRVGTPTGSTSGVAKPGPACGAPLRGLYLRGPTYGKKAKRRRAAEKRAGRWKSAPEKKEPVRGPAEPASPTRRGVPDDIRSSRRPPRQSSDAKTCAQPVCTFGRA